ncbi:MAG TPA: histidine--tRNA ligase [Bacteroidales bacterium]|nr:histidine--tRNA ligase [Bacteroidales bacterium]
MAKGPGIPKGTRDFGPSEMVRRNYIFNTIRSVFRLYGYSPLETPAMENLSTLTGKYGDEGDRLLFKILNSGDFRSGIEDGELLSKSPAELASTICEKGLRYDLTVPFARYVVQHRNEISFPFKRYQIQPVWRADKPQKGRYREFYQCDVDVVGDNSLFNEYELIKIIDEVFSGLSIRTKILLNNRKILTGIAEKIGEKDKITDITIAIDKLEKIGIDKVRSELYEKGLSEQSVNDLQPILFLRGNPAEKLDELEKVLSGTKTGPDGIREIRSIFEYLENDNCGSEIDFDITLARGLDYYTGAIIEVKALDTEIGSICGGGRYDDLTGIFGMPGVSGVGVSFGADRIYDVMNKLDQFPDYAEHGTKVLFINFGKEEEKYCIPLINKLRSEGISSELFPSAVKIKKQMSYANSRKIPWVIMAGENEMKEDKLTVKNMDTGKQDLIGRDILAGFISKNGGI